jgi:hypothetical protein
MLKLRPIELIRLATRQYDGMAPTHFFGELTKTPEGCMYLKEKGLVSEFAEIVRLHGMEASDQAIMTNVKSVLWALVSAILSAVMGNRSESEPTMNAGQRWVDGRGSTFPRG